MADAANNPLTLYTWHQYPFSSYCSLYISQGADKKNLVKNPERQS